MVHEPFFEVRTSITLPFDVTPIAEGASWWVLPKWVRKLPRSPHRACAFAVWVDSNSAVAIAASAKLFFNIGFLLSRP